MRTSGNDLALLNTNGTERILVRPNAQNFNSMSACSDRYLLFDSYEDNKGKLIRTDADGANPLTLSEGSIIGSECSADGKWVMYDTGKKLFRLPVEGGSPTEIAASPLGLYGTISPDGNWIAYGYQEPGAVPLPKVAMIPATGGAPVHVFDWPGNVGGLSWSPDQKSLQYLQTRNGATNLWEQPIAGGPPRQVTNFSSGRIFSFAWSRDGKQLYLTKGDATSDVVLITNFR